ncbi:MAG: Fe-S cluster assembly protein HesB [Acidimicrobiales bacterium]|nr:Fe-S cluster assembly protein HesB [Acidimicrobiales bacterium]
MATRSIPVTNNPEANQLLVTNPFALLVGMLLDQQIPMEWAFLGPYTLQERLGKPLDAATVAAMEPDALEALFREKPALHRYPGSMAKRTHALAQTIVDRYGGETSTIWKSAKTGEELYRRLRELPGFGDEKAKIFMAVLAKRLGIRPKGWEQVAAPFSDDTPRSVADITGPDALERVREFKKLMKTQGKGKDG